MQPLKAAINEVVEVPGRAPDIKEKNDLWLFIRHNPTVPISFCTGLLVAGMAITFTLWLSGQKLKCPDWATNCSITPTVAQFRDNLGVVQGLVTFVFSTSLAALAYAAHAWSEASIWPLLAQRPYSISQIDTFLSASRGSVPSTPVAFRGCATIEATLVMICTALITLAPLTAAPLVGSVFHLQNNTLSGALSRYTGGGGTSRHFRQQNPPKTLLAPAISRYVSWAEPLSQEPMTDYRDWFVDRFTLADKGNLTGHAIRLQKSISCRAHQVTFTPNNTVETQLHHRYVTGGDGQQRRGSRYVELLWRPHLAVWADDCDLPSPTRARSTIVFAAVNGTIENGASFSSLDNFTAFQAIACNIDIELVDDIVCIGDNECTDKELTTQEFTTIRDITGAANEVALWMTMAPIVVGVSVGGVQPMFYHFNQAELPHVYTTTSGGRNNWALEEVETFINVSVSAVAQELVVNRPANTRLIRSSTLTVKLAKDRFWLLLLPVVVILLAMSVLTYGSVLLHRKYKIPIMRSASLSELLSSSQTTFIAEKAADDLRQPHKSSQLGTVKVMFGRTVGLDRDETIIAGLGDRVQWFE